LTPSNETKAIIEKLADADVQENVWLSLLSLYVLKQRFFETKKEWMSLIEKTKHWF
jgi:hypothetical protein